jgi:stage V sporulation protein K
LPIVTILKNNNNPKSFFDQVYRSFLSMIEGSESDIKEIVSAGDLEKLKLDCSSLTQLYKKLNDDQKFITELNADLNNSALFSSERFILSEIIHIYEKFAIKEDERSKFVLAYYYDVLRNQHFADNKHAGNYNQLINSKEYVQLLEKIKVENKLYSANKEQSPYILSEILAGLHPEKYKILLLKYEKFINNAFGLTFNKKEDFGEVLGIKKREIKKETTNAKPINAEDSLEKVLNELNQLVGLEKVKSDVLELINFLEIQKKREKQGLKNAEITLHTVFLGPPGTGKTTVARLLGRIYKHLGYLSKGQLLETDREGLIAGYVGQTATKVNKAVEDSLGGVLFIDEAYALNQSLHGNDYGAEAISTLLKRMEDHRSDLAVVVAGYTEPMKSFIESNPGLRSRFNRYFHFDHFKPEELLKVFKTFCEKSDFITEKEADEKLLDTFELCYEKRNDGFGNARDVRNIFDICVQNHANRIIKLKSLNKKILKTITEEDIPEPKDTLEHISFFSSEE